MKHVKLFEQFLNEGTLKEGRDKDLANAILAYFYAPEGTPEAKEIVGNPLRTDINVKQQDGLSGWGKDVVRALSKARRIPSDFLIGDVIEVAADNGKSYYFDDVDLVEGDKTIISGALKLKYRAFIEELIKQGVIQTPIYK